MVKLPYYYLIASISRQIYCTCTKLIKTRFFIPCLFTIGKLEASSALSHPPPLSHPYPLSPPMGIVNNWEVPVQCTPLCHTWPTTELPSGGDLNQNRVLIPSFGGDACGFCNHLICGFSGGRLTVGDGFGVACITIACWV